MKHIPAAAITFVLGVSPASLALANTVASDSSTPAGQVLSDKDSPLVQAAINTDEKIVTVSGTFRLDHPLLGEDTASAEYVMLTAQTPLAQGQNYTNTATLDGLTKATSFSFKFVHSSPSFVSGTGGARALSSRESQAACRAIQELARSNPPSNDPFFEAAQPYYCRDPQAALNKRKALDDEYKAHNAGGPEAEKQIVADALVEHDLEKKYDAWTATLEATPKPAWAVIVNGKVGYEQHMYFDPVTLAPNTANKTPWQAGIAGSYLPEGNLSLNLGFNYQESFQDADMGTTRTKCINSGATCVNGFIGAPALRDRALLSFDLRWIPKPFGIPIGFDPGVTYDAVADAEAFQFPVYFMTDADHNLTGGVRYDWTSATHTSTVGLFVSTAFNVFSG